MSNHRLKKACWVACVILLSAVAWLHFAGRINFVTVDLGRHLTNGRIFLSSGHILNTNYYSYTHPDFLALCHHWGIGPLFYAVWKVWGFLGLSSAYTGVLWITFLLSAFIAWRSSFMGVAILASVLALPLAASRIEIRPEGISTLFLMVEFFLLSQWRRGFLEGKWLWFIALIQLLWVNIHILFFTGLALTAIYWVGARLGGAAQTGRTSEVRNVFIGAVLASLFNPFTLPGLSQPLLIFQGYGYDLAENQSVFFMIKRFPATQVYGYFLAMFLSGVMLVIARMIKEKSWRRALPQSLALLFFGLLAVKSVRGIAMFGFVLIPVAAESLSVLLAGARPRQGVAGVLAAVLVGLAALVPYSFWSPLKKFSSYVEDPRYKNSLFYVLARPTLWGGLMPGVERSAEFFKAAGLKGPVFNNYDIGGYIIYYFFPNERPFVDNRPEAYPVDFFKRVYQPMQESEAVWSEARGQYGFELIYFFRHDMTPWAQPFLLRRLDDPQWAPVFVDDYTIILARRGGVNQPAISRYELPRAMFRTVSDQ